MYMLEITFKVLKSVMGKEGKVNTELLDELFSEEIIKPIADWPGLKWKVWGMDENENDQDNFIGAGFYLFENEKDARERANYAKKNYPLNPAMSQVETRIYSVLENYSRACRAPIDTPANPSKYN